MGVPPGPQAFRSFSWTLKLLKNHDSRASAVGDQIRADDSRTLIKPHPRLINGELILVALVVLFLHKLCAMTYPSLVRFFQNQNALPGAVDPSTPRAPGHLLVLTAAQQLPPYKRLANDHPEKLKMKHGKFIHIHPSNDLSGDCLLTTLPSTSPWVGGECIMTNKPFSRQVDPSSWSGGAGQETQRPLTSPSPGLN